METKEHACIFFIESPQGEFSVGVCRICGVKKEFANAPENAPLHKTHKERWNQKGFKRTPKK